MGIPGLTTYVSNNAGIFYKDHALHDTLLLIDGNSLASQIYLELTVTNSAFGGDYERYKHSVEKFMKLLLSCNILPFVVFDGGYEKRKLRTTVSRLKNTIIGVGSFKSVNQQNNVKLFPMFMKEVFKHVTRNLHIPCVQSDLEADFDLIYLARKFHCPILSYDSDFYLNDVEYVPFFNLQLKGGKECQRSSTGRALFCKIYRVENLFRHFGGLSKEFIPLLQCMLGNDYISHMHFKHFLSELNFRYSSGRKSPVSKRLAVLIKWCRAQRSMETALYKIIENLKFHQKTKAIKVLKRTIHDYRMEECILFPYVMEQIEKYKLREKVDEFVQINNVESEEHDELSEIEENLDLDEEESELEEEESEEQIDLVVNENHDIGPDDTKDSECEDDRSNGESEEQGSSSETSVEASPTNTSKTMSKQFNSDYLNIQWLVHAFRHGQLSTHVANMINLSSIFLLPLRENIKLDSVHAASYPLLSTIAKLLLTGDSRGERALRVYTRAMRRMKVQRLKCDDDQTEVCNIIELSNYDLEHRRRLLLTYLNLENISIDSLNEVFPQEWDLLVLGLLYWGNISSHVNSYHIKCLVVCFIFLNIVQAKCGYFENMVSFKKKYAKKLNEFKTKIQNERIERKKIKKSGKKKQAASEKENVTVVPEHKENTKNTIQECVGDLIDGEDNRNKNNSQGGTQLLGITNVFQSIVLKSPTEKQYETIETNKIPSPKLHSNIELIYLYEQFLQLSHFDANLRSNHTCFNKDVIHVFCEFQSIFYFINMLNSILNFPFYEIDMSCIYSGTFLYNLYSKVYNKENNISLLFKHCDNLFAIYQSIVNFLENKINSDVFKLIPSKTKRKKKKKNKSNIEESEEEDIVDETGVISEEGSEGLVDSDNMFSILKTVHI